MTKKIQCPFCLEKFSITIYPEDGEHQDLIQDCEICCHPIDIKVFVDQETLKISVIVEKSSGF
jgi:hypothetical protein